MKTLLRILALVAVLLTSGMFAATTAQADTLTFKVKSDYDYEVRIAFYSKARNVNWPGGGKSWLIDDYDVTDYKLSCNRNEYICYGAWAVDDDLHWGVGEHSEFGCKNCCFTCKGNTTTRLINLGN